ncbi:MAG TPA: hypothetical protein VKT78_00975 [Fimbriimonadaceae bacterium]|nr:hypothetical protein [Fimbriimonadaceae bacterium]
MDFRFEIVDGVEVAFEGSSDVSEATRDLVDNISGLTSTIVGLEQGSDEPRLIAHLGEARANLLLAASAVMASVDYRCTLQAPPEDIRARPGPTGDMVRRCFHQPSHCWDGAWKLIDCPG